MKRGTGYQKFLPSQLALSAEVLFALEAALPADAKAGTLALAMTLLAFEGRFPGRAMPAVPTLARFARMSERTVEKHLKILCDAGVLVVEAHPGKTSGYVLAFPQKPDLTPAGSAEPQPVVDAAEKTADDLRGVVHACDQVEALIKPEAAARAHVDPHTRDRGGEGGDPDYDRAKIRQIIREELEAFAAGERRPAPEASKSTPAPAPAPTEKRPPRDRVGPRPKERPGLYSRKPPALSRELEKALYALPGGRACGAMLSRRVPAEHHPWVASKVLGAAERLAKRGEKLRDAELIGLRIVRDDLDDHRQRLAETAAAKEHDAPFDPDTELGPPPWGEPPPDIDTRANGRPQPPPATTLRSSPCDRTAPPRETRYEPPEGSAKPHFQEHYERIMKEFYPSQAEAS